MNEKLAEYFKTDAIIRKASEYYLEPDQFYTGVVFTDSKVYIKYNNKYGIRDESVVERYLWESVFHGAIEEEE